jgi:hypothetical protein
MPSSFPAEVTYSLGSSIEQTNPSSSLEPFLESAALRISLTAEDINYVISTHHFENKYTILWILSIRQ